MGLSLYCNRVCAGIGRRSNKTPDQLKKEKAAYDKLHRKKEHVKAKKAEYFKKDYKANPDKYKKERQRRMAAHVEYCRRPEYKEYKKQYDKKYRAIERYGEYADAFLITEEIFSLIPNREELKYEQGVRNKSQIRKRKWKTLMQNH